jgi:hypothetical protein
MGGHFGGTFADLVHQLAIQVGRKSARAQFAAFVKVPTRNPQIGSLFPRNDHFSISTLVKNQRRSTAPRCKRKIRRFSNHL